MRRNVTHKDLMKKLNILEKEIGEIKKGSKKQIDMAVVAVATAYILLGVSIHSYSYSAIVRNVIAAALIILGLVVIYKTMKPYRKKKK